MSSTATQISREINFSHGSKTGLFDHFSSSDFWNLGNFWHFHSGGANLMSLVRPKFYCENDELRFTRTVWQFQDYSATQILRDINFGHFEETKNTILTSWAALNLEFVGICDIIKCELFLKWKFKAFKIVKTTVFDLGQNQFCGKLEWQNC